MTFSGETFSGEEDLLVVDPAALVVLRELDEADGSALVAEVIGLFVRDFPLRLTALQSALDASQLGAAAAVAHTIKGSCAAVGAQRMAQTCEQLESFVRAGDVAGGWRATGRLATEYHLVKPALEADIATMDEDGEPR